MKNTVSHYIPPPNPLTSPAPQAFSNNLTMPSTGPFDVGVEVAPHAGDDAGSGGAGAGRVEGVGGGGAVVGGPDQGESGQGQGLGVKRVVVVGRVEQPLVGAIHHVAERTGGRGGFALPQIDDAAGWPDARHQSCPAPRCGR